MPAAPSLLVSVRNSEEAQIALNAGVDILDFKEPAAGALAPVAWPVLQKAVVQVGRIAPNLAISVACGEVLDPMEPATERLGPVQYLKLGLAGLGGRQDWVAAWLERRQQLIKCFASNHGDSPNWIAVVYVDHLVANAPQIPEVIGAAIETGCRGVLFDTYSKGGGSLLQQLSIEELSEHVRRIQSAGLLMAAAGKLRCSDLPPLRQCGVDVVAVRSAACQDQNREKSLCGDAIQKLNAALGRSESQYASPLHA